jgi:hypothetical protein
LNVCFAEDADIGEPLVTVPSAAESEAAKDAYHTRPRCKADFIIQMDDNERLSVLAWTAEIQQ